MHRTLRMTLAATLLAGAAMGGFAAGQVGALAQPAPPMAGQQAEGGGPPGPPPWAGRGGPGRWDHHRGPGGPFGPRGPFGLFPRVEDKALTAAEVQKIAEGFLLLMGQRSWRVVDVRDTGSSIEFGFAAEQGAAFAKFKVDKKTGRPERIA